MTIAFHADDRLHKLRETQRLMKDEPDSKEFWQAYCAFIEAEAELAAAVARADKANGTWELKVVE